MSTGNDPQAHWPIKAYNNPDFLNSPAAREIRILCEFAEPERRLRKHRINNTIIFFGSARIPGLKSAEENLAAAEAALAAEPESSLLQQGVTVARRLLRAAPYHEMARELSRKLSEWSLTLPNESQRFYVCSGAGPGIMEAANHGAHQAGARSVGLGISLPFEPEQNAYIPDELRFEFHYFMVRKYWFAYMAKAMVVCPGGFGTMDELFELMTLIQTGKYGKDIPVVLLGKEFWNSVFNFQALLEWGVISDKDLELFRIIDDVDEAAEFIISELSRIHHLA